MIIYGHKMREIELASGQFHCPKRDDLRACKHKRVARYFTLFFIPLSKTLGEFVECQVCGRAYKPEILSYSPLPLAERLKATALVKSDLEAGGSLGEVQEKLIAEGMEEQTAKRVVETLTSERRKGLPGMRAHVPQSCDGMRQVRPSVG